MPLTLKCETHNTEHGITDKCGIFDGDARIASIDYTRNGNDPANKSAQLQFQSNVGGSQHYESFAETKLTSMNRIRDIDAKISQLESERSALLPGFFPWFRPW